MCAHILSAEWNQTPGIFLRMPAGCGPGSSGQAIPSCPGQVHLVGVAGSGMRSLAEVLLGWGWRVSGSDLAPAPVRRLAEAGLQLYQGHSAEHVPPRPDLVICSDAIAPENPEVARARSLGVPVLSYFQALGQWMHGKIGIAIAGTHGKSTTTAMAAHLLVAAGHDPTVLCGAAPCGGVSGGRAGHGPLMLVEACEYRANFLHLHPQQVAILGIEPDHFDYYASWQSLLDAFARFAASIPERGLLLTPRDCTAARQIASTIRCRVETFGFGPQADWSGRQVTDRRGRYRFTLHYRGRRVCRIALRVPGRHNAHNALAAAALALLNGVQPEQIARGLGDFPGLHRRLEWIGTWRDVTLVDDFAHHPTEVRAGLVTVRQMYPGRRVWCVFQPHQASRTAYLLDSLAASLQIADQVIVAEIYRAREPAPQPGEVTAEDLARATRRRGAAVAAVHTPGPILRLLRTALRPGDVLITMGAGNIREIQDGLLQGF